jgi:NADH-quinone oxidoreductase subunit C
MAAINYDILPEILRLNFNSDILRLMILQRRRIVVQIRKESLLEIANYFLDELKYRFIIASGMVADNGYDILYHFSDDRKGYVVSLKVNIEGTKPEIESLSNMINAANWIEREIHELFGIKFKNHPNLTKLISDGNWKEGEYPYARPQRDNKKISKR